MQSQRVAAHHHPGALVAEPAASVPDVAALALRRRHDELRHLLNADEESAPCWFGSRLPDGGERNRSPPEAPDMCVPTYLQ